MRSILVNPLRLDPSRTGGIVRPVTLQIEGVFASDLILNASSQELRHYLNHHTTDLLTPLIQRSYAMGINRAYDQVNTDEERNRDEYIANRLWVGQPFVDTLSHNANAYLANVTNTLYHQLTTNKRLTDEEKEQAQKDKARAEYRAKLIARTEAARAQAEGQLDEFEDLEEEEEIQGIEVLAEWSTAGDSLVCDICASHEGEIMSIEAARGMIPIHPACRCAWIPYVGLKRGKKDKEKGKVKGRSAGKKQRRDKPRPSLIQRITDTITDVAEDVAESLGFTAKEPIQPATEQPASPPDQSEWKRHIVERGPNKGKEAWKNTRTGKIHYGDEPPGSRAAQTQQGGAGGQQGQQKGAQTGAGSSDVSKTVAGGKTDGQGGKAAKKTTTTGAGQAVIDEAAQLVSGGSGDTPELRDRLSKMSHKEVMDLQKKVGAPGGKSTDEKREKILEHANKQQQQQRQQGVSKAAQATKQAAATVPTPAPVVAAPKPAPKAKTPGQPTPPEYTFKQLMDMAAKDPFAVEKLLASKGVPAQPQMAHGMSNPEAMKMVKVNGIEIYYPPGKEKEVAQLINGMAIGSQRELPPQLMTGTQRIIYSTQRNNQDAYWEKQYNMPGLVSAATGGDGTIVVYNGKPIPPGTLAHEMGHNKANEVWGQQNPGTNVQPQYAAAQAKEQPVSSYGAKSPAEDWAEACTKYATDPEQFRKDFPLKYAAVEKILGPPPPKYVPGKPDKNLGKKK